jgi:hypothetical protein
MKNLKNNHSAQKINQNSAAKPKISVVKNGD